MGTDHPLTLTLSLSEGEREVMDISHEPMLAHCEHERDRTGDTPVAEARCCGDKSVAGPDKCCMGSFDLRSWTHIGAMNVARLSKVEAGRAVATDSTLESRATCRFMGSPVLHSLFNGSLADTCRVSLSPQRGERVGVRGRSFFTT